MRHRPVGFAGVTILEYTHHPQDEGFMRIPQNGFKGDNIKRHWHHDAARVFKYKLIDASAYHMVV
jgi:hypothetical protein